MDDDQLLALFVRERSADAFDQLVRRHVDRVYAAALRQVGRRESAEDVTQAVFLVLARKAHTLARVPSLAAWLHKVTRYAAIDVMRQENARLRHERAAAALRNEGTRDAEQDDSDWSRVAGLIDETLLELKEQDRVAIVLRYFEEKSFAEIGQRLDLSADTARKRVERATERLRKLFERRGVRFSASALASGIAASRAATPASAAAAAIALRALSSSPVSEPIRVVAHAALSKLAGPSILVPSAAVVAVLAIITGGIVISKTRSSGSGKQISAPAIITPATAPTTTPATTPTRPPASRGIVSTFATGTLGKTLASAPPGTPVHLDFRTRPDGTPRPLRNPFEPVSIRIAFECRPAPQSVTLRLSGGQTYELPLVTRSQAIIQWSDPQLFDPATIQVPHEPLTAAWKDELADGVLDATLWVSGTPSPVRSFSFQAELAAKMEPATSPRD